MDLKNKLQDLLQIVQKKKNDNLSWGAFAAAALATVLILFVIYINGQIFNRDTPKRALHKTVEAIHKKNPALFEKYVDSDALASNVVNQVFLPNTSAVQGALGKAVGNLSDLIRPTLANSLEEELVSSISNGLTAPVQDDTNTLINRLKSSFMGNEIEFKGFGKTKKTDNTATSTAKFYRADLDHSFSLNIDLERGEKVWRIVDIPNFGLTLNALAQLEAQQAEAEKNAQLEKMAEIISISDVQKASNNANWAVGKGIFLSAAFTNTEKDEIDRFVFDVHVAEKSGKHLKTFTIQESDNIASGMTLEKTWPVSLNPLLPNDMNIYNLPAEELAISIAIRAIQFSDGKEINTLINNKK